MWRVLLWLTAPIAVLAAAACGSTNLAVGQHSHTFRDGAGWTIKVPPGWRAARFSDAKDGITSAGVQLSNLRLAPPALVPGFPIQANRGILPGGGVGLVIASDTDRKVPHGPVAMPPLPAFDAPGGWKYWNAGSAPAGVPYIEILWFRVHGATFVATAKIGPKATHGALNAVAEIIRSLRPCRTQSRC